MNYLLYQAYGSNDIINEAIYSLLSFYKTTDDATNNEIKIVIYTDDIPAFDHFFSERPFIYMSLTEELIKEWKGNIGFVHRVKIKILQDFFSNHQDANTLYVDSDTIFKANPSKLFKSVAEGNFVMHIMEGIIKDRPNPVFKKLFKYLYSNDIILSDVSKIRVPLTTAMWNAGVIGMNASKKDVLDKALDFTDSLYPHFPKHIVEQFAFSFYLQTNGEIIAAEADIFHYWNFKEFRLVLSSFFECFKDKDLNFLYEKMDKIDPQKLILPKLKQERLSSFGRFLKRLSGNRWEMDLTRFDWDK